MNASICIRSPHKLALTIDGAGILQRIAENPRSPARWRRAILLGPAQIAPIKAYASGERQGRRERQTIFGCDAVGVFQIGLAGLGEAVD